MKSESNCASQENPDEAGALRKRLLRLGSDEIRFFAEEGYLVVKGLLDPAQDLDPIIAEYSGVLDRLASHLYKQGTVASTYAGQPFSERFIRLCHDAKKFLRQHFEFTLPQKDIRSDTPIWVGPAIFNMLRNERLLDAVEDLIGPEIYSNPVQHVRMKIPEDRALRDPSGALIDGVTLWHQDGGVVLPEADQTEMLTVWFPLLDAPIESGCLHLLPRSHRKGLRVHCPRSGTVSFTAIPDSQLADVAEAVSLPLMRGDVLFMHRLTPHSSLPNLSQNLRCSLDLRYNPVGQPTGRGAFPGFVARSRAHPETELRDQAVWAQMWYDTRRRLVETPEPTSFNRWDAKAVACA